MSSGTNGVAVLSFVTALDAEGRLELLLSSERLAGYEEGLGYGVGPELVRDVQAERTESPRGRATLELLRIEKGPTAILAMSDVLAVGALLCTQAAAELGIGGPDRALRGRVRRQPRRHPGEFLR